MNRKLRLLLIVGVLTPTLLLSGCLFNIFQTARMVGAGNVAITFGSGLLDPVVDGDPNWSLTPQVRLAVGLSDAAEFGMQTGALVPLSSGDFGWLGARGDFKFSIVDDPETFSLAMGFGAGYGLEYLNWGLFGEVFFNVNTVLPIFLTYQPTFPLQGEGFAIWHHIAGGLRLPISETAAVLIIVDYRNPELFSYGIGFEIAF